MITDLLDRMSVAEFSKKWNLNDCIYLVSAVWNSVTSSTLKNAWKNFLPVDNIENVGQESLLHGSSFINRIPGQRAMTLEDVKKWIKIDRHHPTWRPLSFTDIVNLSSRIDIQEAEDVVEVQEEFAENQEMEAEREPTASEIMLCITQLCNWGKGKTKITPK